MFEPWIIVFNEKLQGYHQLKDCIKKAVWDDCDAVDVKRERMVTVRNSIKVWVANKVKPKT